MYSSLNDVKFLAQSSNRVAVLDALDESPRPPHELREVTGASRMTVHRILDDLKDRGWIIRENGQCESTHLGAIPNMSDKAHVVGPDGITEFETPPGEDVVVIARGDEPEGDYDLLSITVSPGFDGVTAHVHHDNDEAFYVLEGEIHLQIGDEEHRLTPGCTRSDHGVFPTPTGLPATDLLGCWSCSNRATSCA